MTKVKAATSRRAIAGLLAFAITATACGGPTPVEDATAPTDTAPADTAPPAATSSEAPEPEATTPPDTEAASSATTVPATTTTEAEQAVPSDTEEAVVEAPAPEENEAVVPEEPDVQPAADQPLIVPELVDEFTTTAGTTIDLESLQGQDVVLWFWAPW